MHHKPGKKTLGSKYKIIEFRTHIEDSGSQVWFQLGWEGGAFRWWCSWGVVLGLRHWP